MLNKYRPETKEAKEERLKELGATKAAGGAAPQGKKPMFAKCGINHIATLVEQKKATMVALASPPTPIPTLPPSHTPHTSHLTVSPEPST